MRTDTVLGLPQGLYRPGSGFSAAELHVMTHEGAVRPVLGDLYACSSIPDAPRLRAMACRALLSGSLRAHAVLCGESAAWVHLGAGAAPSRITVITAGVYRRRTAGPIPWQVHQVPLLPEEQLVLQGVPVTTPLRTAADLFLGVGTVPGRRALDVSRPALRTDTTPKTDATPSREGLRGESRDGDGRDSDGDGSAERWAGIRRLALANPDQIQLTSLLGQLQRQLGGQSSRGGVLSRRHERIEALLGDRIFGG